MKHLRIYLAILVLVCTSVVGFWIYTRYFKSEESASLTFSVNRGSLDELVRARGKIVTQKAYDLAFATSGTIQTILVKEGEHVREQQPLVQLDTRSLVHERARLASVLSQRQSAYDKLLAGTRSEEIKVYATKVQSAEAALTDANQSLGDVQTKTEADLTALYEQVPDLLVSASVNADDAIHQQTEALFSNDNGTSPKLTMMFSNFSYTSELEMDRIVMNQELKALALGASSGANASPRSLDGYLLDAETHLARIQTFLDTLASALNFSINVPDATLTTYKSNINLGRTNVNASRTSITALKQKIAVQKTANQQLLTQAQTTVNTAKNTVKLSQDELSLQSAGALSQDLSSARAAVTEIQDQIGSTDDQIEKSTLKAPTEGTISFVAFEAHEVVQAGVVVVNFSSDGQKIESDVSELDIARIREDGTQLVTIKLDAFPGTILNGHVTTIDTQEIIKDGDTYYRVNVLLGSVDHLNIRSGMSTDVAYHVATVKDALTVPAFVVHKKNGQQIVTVMQNKKKHDVVVKTGVTDGDQMEILEGLTEGEIVVSSAL